MTIDECIYFLQELKRTVSWGADQKDEEDFCESAEEFLEELKAIKEMDLDIPQHFTNEQSYWIVAYCIKRNGEFYNQALEDVTDIASWHQKGLSGYYTITSEELERLKAGGKNENGGI